ncbi:MAG: polysaccharide deacetylase family protein [Gammaproteobacteria bacterium]|nr:polysaccharide deacetylase family protein [Gammaproteobacteria bacterium]
MTATLVAVACLAILLAALFSLRYAWWRGPVDYRRPRILMYHMIRCRRPSGRFNKLRVAPAEFERQLEWLVDHGWRFAFLSDLDREAGQSKTVVLTFDDGYRDNYTTAHPLLLKYGAKATLFLVVDRFDRDWSTTKKAHHDSGELMQEPKLTDAEVREMLQSGVWELGAHTLTHALLPGLTDKEKREEIGGGKAELEATFATEVSSFAYPFGIFGTDDETLAGAVGYDHAVTTEAGISTDTRAEALRLKRVKVSGKEGALGFSIRLRTGKRGLLD